MAYRDEFSQALAQLCFETHGPKDEAEAADQFRTLLGYAVASYLARRAIETGQATPEEEAKILAESLAKHLVDRTDALAAGRN